jgi:hypothetical protein
MIWWSFDGVVFAEYTGAEVVIARVKVGSSRDAEAEDTVGGMLKAERR